MKKLFFGVVSLLVLATPFFNTYTVKADGGDPVVFADAKLEAAVRKDLGINEPTPVLEIDMLRLSKLSSSRGAGITNLSGLEFAYNLKSIDLYGNRGLTDISQLSGLLNLTYIDAQSTAIADLSPLSGHYALTTVYLSGGTFSDISVVSGWPNIQKLMLQNDYIEDLTPLANLTTLKDLVVNGIFSDVSVIANLTNLTRLSIYSPNVTSIASLAPLTKLTNFSLRYSQVSDISVLANNRDLMYVSLAANEISDISPLAGLDKIYWLAVWDNKLTDVSVVSTLTGLILLEVNKNAITELPDLSALDKLQTIDFTSNQLTDISAMSDVGDSLYTANFAYNLISDFSPLANASGLQNLTVNNNATHDLSALSELSISYFTGKVQSSVGPTVELNQANPLSFKDYKGDDLQLTFYNPGRYENGEIIWEQEGYNMLGFTNGSDFSGTFAQTVTPDVTAPQLTADPAITYQTGTIKNEADFLTDVHATTDDGSPITSDFDTVVDMNVAGDYIVTLTATDASNNTATAIVVVHVVDPLTNTDNNSGDNNSTGNNSTENNSEENNGITGGSSSNNIVNALVATGQQTLLMFGIGTLVVAAASSLLYLNRRK